MELGRQLWCQAIFVYLVTEPALVSGKSCRFSHGATEIQNQIWCQAIDVCLATEPWSYGASFGSQTTHVYLATEPWSYEVNFGVRNPLSI